VAAGLGLGLFISEQIVAAHGGTIEVESQIGEGACSGCACPWTRRRENNRHFDATSA